MSHTPEPWELYDTGDGIKDHVAGRAGHICFCEIPEDARRIVACVNACAGIPTETLEKWLANGSNVKRVTETAGTIARAAVDFIMAARAHLEGK